MAQQAQVNVVGLKALERDLKSMSSDITGPLYAAIRTAGKTAVDPVAARARSEVPHDSDDLSGSVRASGTRTGGNVRMGSAAVPYAGWIEFGGTRPQGPTDRSGRPYMPSGRYLFPAAQGLAAQAATLYSAALEKVLASSGVWTNTSANPGSIHD